jgi:hypothetical protein
MNLFIMFIHNFELRVKNKEATRIGTFGRKRSDQKNEYTYENVIFNLFDNALNPSRKAGNNDKLKIRTSQLLISAR